MYIVSTHSPDCLEPLEYLVNTTDSVKARRIIEKSTSEEVVSARSIAFDKFGVIAL